MSPGPFGRTAALRDRVLQLGSARGLVAVGVCGAEPFEDARVALETRRDAGLHGDMAFTYRNPARSTDPAATMPTVQSMVVGALRYDSSQEPAPDGLSARVARYATEDHYAALRSALEAMAGELRDAGHRAQVVADDNAMVDRAVAVRAGIGWYGKNSNVLVPGQGSWVVLGSVLTDALLEPTGAPLDDGCGGCRRCLDGCPTGAIVAPGVVDARRCLAWLVQSPEHFPRQFREALGDRIYGCDDCQEVCPPGRRSEWTPVAPPPGAAPADAAPADRDPGAWVPVSWMLDATDDELLDRLGRWYVPRRDARFLRRNALIVAGNCAALDDAGVIAHLEDLLDGDDDMLAGYAAWAALRLGRNDLLAPAPRAQRPAVAAELAEPPTPRYPLLAGADVPEGAVEDDNGAR